MIKRNQLFLIRHELLLQDSCKYVNELVKPVLACFRDADSQVRYYSCEALYNIVKVTRGSVLPFFNEVFDALSKVSDFCMVSYTKLRRRVGESWVNCVES